MEASKCPLLLPAGHLLRHHISKQCSGLPWIGVVLDWHRALHYNRVPAHTLFWCQSCRVQPLYTCPHCSFSDCSEDWGGLQTSFCATSQHLPGKGGSKILSEHLGQNAQLQLFLDLPVVCQEHLPGWMPHPSSRIESLYG